MYNIEFFKNNWNWENKNITKSKCQVSEHEWENKFLIKEYL